MCKDEIDVESTTENILSPYLYVESTTENIMLPYRLFDGGTHRSLLLAERAEHGTVGAESCRLHQKPVKLLQHRADVFSTGLMCSGTHKTDMLRHS